MEWSKNGKTSARKKEKERDAKGRREGSTAHMSERVIYLSTPERSEPGKIANGAESGGGGCECEEMMCEEARLVISLTSWDLLISLDSVGTLWALGR